MIYEIVNPSDAYTIKADDLKVAAIACCILGNGQYSFRPLGPDGVEVPFFMFGGADEWFQEQFGAGVESVFVDVHDNHALELAECLESCLIGSLNDRREYESALSLIESPENREKFRADRHKQRRTSMNDIGNRGYRIAKRLREDNPSPLEKAPQQVFVG